MIIHLVPQLLLLSLIALFSTGYCVETPDGFQGAPWGVSPGNVQSVTNAPSWSRLPDDKSFPPELNISRYQSRQEIAGYPSSVVYYFSNDSFFQATITFNFDYLKTFDFNYNVFISVDKYYSVIHDHTVTFVRDIYDLLTKKYGKKEPVFKGLDPRYIFTGLDKYFRLERWNFRYHPAEYYKKIVTSAYARWDFPKTCATFSINISAADKRFDYQLSLSSLDMEQKINKAKDKVRMRGL